MREEEEEEEKKKRREEEGGAKKVWKLTLSMDSSLDHMDFVWNCIDTCLWLVDCRKPNPGMSSCMEIITSSFVFPGFCYEKT